MEDVYTVADLARKTGLSQAKVKNALKGVEPALTASDGYFKLYSHDALKGALRAQNWALLVALGYEVNELPEFERDAITENSTKSEESE